MDNRTIKAGFEQIIVRQQRPHRCHQLSGELGFVCTIMGDSFLTDLINTNFLWSCGTCGTLRNVCPCDWSPRACTCMCYSKGSATFRSKLHLLILCQVRVRNVGVGKVPQTFRKPIQRSAHLALIPGSTHIHSVFWSSGTPHVPLPRPRNVPQCIALREYPDVSRATSETRHRVLLPVNGSDRTAQLVEPLSMCSVIAWKPVGRALRIPVGIRPVDSPLPQHWLGSQAGQQLAGSHQ